MWVADAEEGEFYYTISSEQFKLAVFIILPRVVNTSHQCVSHSEMDDNRSGGHENITKDFLTYAVRHLSRLYVGKTKGQEVYWKHHPPNWPEHLTWKNPTSSPKDSTETLREKYKHLRLLVPDEKLSPEERNAFKNFEAGNTDSVKSFMSFNKLNDHINDMRNMLHCLQQPHLQLLDEQLKLLKDEVTSQVSSSVASTSRRPTAADTSSLTLSKKRKHVNPKSVQSKICKTEIPNCSNNIQDNGRKIKIIFPKPTPTSNEFSRVFPQSTVSAQSSVVESPMRNTFSNQSQQSLVSSNNTMSNICIDISKCRTLPDHPETAGSTNVPPSVVASSIIIIHSQYDNPLLGSHEELTVSDSIPVTSLDSGTWSQESNISKEAYDVRLDKQKLNDKVVQDDLQFIENICETTGQNNDFDPSQFINFGT